MYVGQGKKRQLTSHLGPRVGPWMEPHSHCSGLQMWEVCPRTARDFLRDSVESEHTTLMEPSIPVFDVLSSSPPKFMPPWNLRT